MVRDKWMYLPILIVLFFTFACAAPAGAPKFKPLSHRDTSATLDDLKRNWTTYSISYGGGSVGLASALIFDPKEDNRNLVGKDYVDVKDKDTLERVISVIESYTTFNPTLYKIYGPDGDFFGFVFTAHYRPFPRKVDDKTLSLPNWLSQSYIGGP
jgi:hypothetical protein